MRKLPLPSFFLFKRQMFSHCVSVRARTQTDWSRDLKKRLLSSAGLLDTRNDAHVWTDAASENCRMWVHFQLKHKALLRPRTCFSSLCEGHFTAVESVTLHLILILFSSILKNVFYCLKSPCGENPALLWPYEGANLHFHRTLH